VIDSAKGSEAVMMGVEVVYATAAEQVVVRLSVPADCSAWRAVEQSGLLRKFSIGGPQDCKLGVFGHLCQPDQALRDGDRVEIYRPLLADPKSARRQRARRRRDYRAEQDPAG
jgi:putative ubiquitin-RnfH superfamily antitoxin RatB of RatAB toxin-antitoxin module